MSVTDTLKNIDIGACFIQWANTASEKREVKKKIDISEIEHIVVVIGAGCYKDEMYIAKSCRCDMGEIYTVVKKI